MLEPSANRCVGARSVRGQGDERIRPNVGMRGHELAAELRGNWPTEATRNSSERRRCIRGHGHVDILEGDAKAVDGSGTRDGTEAPGGVGPHRRVDVVEERDKHWLRGSLAAERFRDLAPICRQPMPQSLEGFARFGRLHTTKPLDQGIARRLGDGRERARHFFDNPTPLRAREEAGRGDSERRSILLGGARKAPEDFSKQLRS